MATYSRYSKFKQGGQMKLVPYIEIPFKQTDRFEYYIQGKTRLDVLSQLHYNDPNYGWLILMANPEMGGLEFMIPSGVLIRIPYPLDLTISDYEQGIKKYNELYGIE